MSSPEKDCTNNEKNDIDETNSKTVVSKDPTQSRKGSWLCTVASFLILLTAPNFILVFAYTITNLDGSLTQLVDLLSSQNPLDTLKLIWWPYVVGNSEVWVIIAAFAMFELLLMIILPGRYYTGSVTPKGNVPHYKDNGLLAFTITIATFGMLVYYDIFNPSIIYDNFMYLIGALTLLGSIISVILFIKGKYLPSSTDITDITDDGLICDFFLGVELHPQILKCNVKIFTNSRIGMMGWALLLLSYAYKQYQSIGEISDSMGVAVSLQLIYIIKFFHWEQGYTMTLDIMHNKAGFYICWGCLVWVPCVYTSHTLYLVTHPNHLGLSLTTALLMAGILSIYTNYEADYQKLAVRKNKKCKIWRKEVEVIEAKYTTDDGEVRETVLLLSGWWGVARHFHYLPEIIAALCWSLPALFDSPTPYFYVIYLTTLLLHRLRWDNKRCQQKYGIYWEEYCKLVPYEVLPGLF